MSEAEKRKQEEGNGDVSSSEQKKAREDKGSQTAVTDDEVDEFFNILRRLHVAVKYFKEGNDTVRTLSDIESTTLERDSNVEVAGDDVKKDGGPQRREENLILDLNSDPVPEKDPA